VGKGLTRKNKNSPENVENRRDFGISQSIKKWR
jgi:hypothetical protein